MPRGRLTQRQNEAYEFIRAYLDQHRKPPTLKEIGAALGIASTNGVYKLLQALEAKGYIEREKHTARGIEIVETSDDPFGFDGGDPSLPVASRTTSDAPETLRDRPQGTLTVDERLLRRATNPEACLIVRAGDDGMNAAGIHKGDLLIVEDVDWSDLSNGTVAAFLVQDQVLPREFHFANNRLHLRPADRHYTEETFSPRDPGCYVVGPVLGVIRLL